MDHVYNQRLRFTTPKGCLFFVATKEMGATLQAIALKSYLWRIQKQDVEMLDAYQGFLLSKTQRLFTNKSLEPTLSNV